MRSAAFARLLVVILLVAAVPGRVALAGASPVAGTADAAVPAAPGVDQNTAFFWCGFGAATGAGIMALPPLSGWTTYEPALTGTLFMLARTGFGCYFGLVGAAVYSSVEKTVRNTVHAVQGWF